MLGRLGIILIVSGFLLLYNPAWMSLDKIYMLFSELSARWPALLIVIGFIISIPKKRRKYHR